jgi:hypothetical protein
MVIDRRGLERAEDAMVQDDEADREEEGKPVLIERQDADHDEEMEVHLDHTTAQRDQHRGCRHQPERVHRRDELAPAGVRARKTREHRHDPSTLNRVRQPAADDQREAEDAEHMGTQQEGQGPMPHPPHVLTQRLAPWQIINRRLDPPARRPPQREAALARRGVGRTRLTTRLFECIDQRHSVNVRRRSRQS